MQREKYSEQIPSIYTVSLFGAEKVLRKLQLYPQREKLLLKSDDFLEEKKRQNTLIEQMEFFTPAGELEQTAKELADLFLQGQKEILPDDADIRVLVGKDTTGDTEITGGPVSLSLEIHRPPYRIPFKLRLLPYNRCKIYPREKTANSRINQQAFTYYIFPPEEYLAFAFHEILNGLELLNDLSWYKEIFAILTREPLEGRKVWEGLRHILSERPIPSIEKRMETIAGYKNYGYMKKRWKSQSRRSRGHYPQWEQVITVLTAFFTPVFEGVIKDEIFLGDWMPQLGRYLD
ncbi:hypothetical protein D3Z36_02145 [Lachnospiraceae bacterium]|nr:hypothetical protein [Lachnospiraceae bacterium]